MKKESTISIFEVVGSPLCVSSGDGQGVYERIVAAFKGERKVVLSFHNVTVLTSAFLNSAVGQLYGKFGEDEIRASIRVSSMVQDDLALLKRVVENAKDYFADPKKFEQSVRYEYGDDGGQQRI